MTAPAQLKEQICDAAAAQGFDACHIVSAKADRQSDGQGLQDFIAAGHHGQMDWMESRMDERAAPQKLWPRSAKRYHAGGQLRPRMRPVGGLER